MAGSVEAVTDLTEMLRAKAFPAAKQVALSASAMPMTLPSCVRVQRRVVA